MTSNQIAFAKLKEDSRANRTQEGLKSQSLSEEQRHNLAMERTNWFGAETSRQVGMLQAAAANTQAGAAVSQANTQSRKQDFEEYKYKDTGSDWISAQTGKWSAEEEQTRNKNKEYVLYDPYERSWNKKMQDVSDMFWGPLKFLTGVAK